MAKKNRLTRREKFIDNGGNPFLPLSRMVEIRLDEAILRSRLKRMGMKNKVYFTHIHYHCPEGCCLGTPIPQNVPIK